jgi:hypothetical protein
MFLPLHPQFYQGAIFANPVIWFGNVAPDGDANPWMQAPLGSVYIRVTASNVKLFIKTANLAADADWQYMNVT